MSTVTLRVLARGSALVSDVDALHVQPKRFIGRRYDAKLGGWPALEKPTEVPLRTEYIQALRSGDLWPADSFTAAKAGVPFDPTFGNAISTKSNSKDK